jgi:hypothetical protein
MEEEMKTGMLLAVVLVSLVAAAPAAGTTSEGGRASATVDVAVKKFAVSGRQIVGRGELSARLTDVTGATRTTRRPVSFAVVAQRATCRVLTLRLDDLQLDLLGLSVDLSTVNLRLYGSRAARAAACSAGCSAACRGRRFA